MRCLKRETGKGWKRERKAGNGLHTQILDSYQNMEMVAMPQCITVSLIPL